MVKTVKKKSAIEKLVAYDPSRTDYGGAIDAWSSGRREPTARGAWILGEALRRTGGRGEVVPYSSGLLALYALGKGADAVGVLGSCDMAALAPFEETLMALLRTQRAATYVSPYDRRLRFAPPDLDDAEITAKRLADLTASSKLPALKPPFVLASVAEDLERRREARIAWALPNDLAMILEGGAERWFISWAKGASQKTHPASIGQLALPMQFAYAVANSEVDAVQRDEFVVDALTRWFYEVVRPRPADRDDVAMWVSLVTDPSSMTADAARAQLRSYILLAAQRLGASIPGNMLDLDEPLRALARYMIIQYKTGQKIAAHGDEIIYIQPEPRSTN